MQSDLSKVQNLLERALGSLRELKAWFLKEAEIKWEGEFPESLIDDDCMELRGKVGKLRIWRHTKAWLFEFVSEAGESFGCRRPLGRDVSEAWWDYEDILFSVWPYDGVMSKWKIEDQPQWHGELPEWHIIDPSFAATFEHFACEAEQSLIPLGMREEYKALCAKALLVIRNGLPKWQMGVVQWTYVKELDEVIKEVEVAAEKTEADVGAKAGSKEFEISSEVLTRQGEANVSRLIARIIYSMEYLKSWFLRIAVVNWKGICPYSLIEGEDDEGYDEELVESSGVWLITFHGKSYSVIYEGGDGKRSTYNTKSDLGNYEHRLFCLWPYDGVSSIVENEELPQWDVFDPGHAARFEDSAQKVENLLKELPQTDDYKIIKLKAMEVIRNGMAEWRPCYVRWTYIKELDGVVKELETLAGQAGAGVEEDDGKGDRAMEQQSNGEDEKRRIQDFYGFLTEIANEAYRLVSEKAVLVRFQQMIELFCKKVSVQAELAKSSADFINDGTGRPFK